MADFLHYFFNIFFIRAIVVIKLYYFFKILPLDAASAIGGFLGRKIGPLLSVNKLAARNMKNAMPELSDEQVQKNLLGMWDNLGRVVAEFPHMATVTGKLFDKIVEIEGTEFITNAHESKKSSFFFSGHLANWELIPKTMFEKGGVYSSLIYRKSNNPYVEKLIIKTRSKYPANSIPKGTIGARHLINTIKKGEQICLLVDQKQNDGIAVPFFHKDAMTAPAIANLALKYDCAILPIQVVRIGGSRFKIKISAPLEIKKTDDNQNDILNIMTGINKILEGWIRENPAQWFWVHNRWPKD